MMPTARRAVLGLLGVLLLAVALPGPRPILLWGIASLPVALLPAVLIGGLYTLPGFALLRLLCPLPAWPVGSRLALASTISVALPPLLLLLTAPLGGLWQPLTLWLYLLFSAAVVFAPARSASPLRPVWPRVGLTPSDTVLLIVAAAALLVRLYVVRDLPTGLFGDSYHHTMIAQLLVDNGGLFQSWLPYAPLTTMTYHFGLHANVAFVHWLTGMPVTTALLITGQVLNALVVLGLAALVTALAQFAPRLRAAAWVGVWAVLLAGFVTTIPMHFVVWGRYTQLAGQIVLLAAVCIWLVLAHHSQQLLHAPPAHSWRDWLRLVLAGWRVMLLAAILSAAMVLTHYRVTVFTAAMIVSSLVAVVLVARSVQLGLVLAAQAMLVGGGALLLVAAWLHNLFQKGYLLRNTQAFVAGQVGLDRLEQTASIPAIEPLYLPRLLLALAVLGLLIALWQRVWPVVLLAVWALLIVLSMVPRAVGLPGTGAIDGLTAFGTLFIALVPLAAYALVQVHCGVTQASTGRWPTAPVPRISTGIAAAALGAVLLGGLPHQAQIIPRGIATYGNAQIVTPADMQAMAWIATNTAPESRFLVNSFPAYGGTMLAGSDAGWWLPLLAHRASTLPPITYGSEAADSPDFLQRVNALAVALRGKPLTDTTPLLIDATTPEALATLRAAGVSHVYIGATSAPVATAIDQLDISRLQASPAYEIVYDQEGVLIFRLSSEP